VDTVVKIDEYVPLKGLQSVWTAASTAGTIGEFEQGALVLLTVGTANYGATTTALLNGNSRFYFSEEQ